MKICPQCKVQFQEQTYKQKFCCKECTTLHTNAQRLQKLYKTSSRVCVTCKTPLKEYQKKFCSSKCDAKLKINEAENKIRTGEKVAINTLRKYLLNTRPNICEICNGSEWLGRPIPLVMDHIDGDASNDRLDNLRLICPNCDRFTPTFGARNRGRGRQSRGIKRYDKYDKNAPIV